MATRPPKPPAVPPVPVTTGGTVGARALGPVLLAAAAAAGWFFVLCPLHLAEVGAAQVRVGPRAFVVAPTATLAGLALLFGGPRVLPLLVRPPRNGWEVTVVLGFSALAVAFGGAGWWWTGARLHALSHGGW